MPPFRLPQQGPAIPKGLLPGLARTTIQDPYVIDGENFLFDVTGPYSGFGADYPVPAVLGDPLHGETVRIPNTTRVFRLGAYGIYEYDTASEVYAPVYVLSAGATGNTPWSTAYVGSNVYFAKAGAGIIEYNPTTGIWTSINGGSVPSGVVGIANSRGRLIAVGATSVAYSALDDGSDFTPVLGGPGAQSISAMTGGSPYGVKEVVGGFLVYTNKGIFAGIATDNVAIFRFTVVSRLDFPINAFAIASLTDTSHVMLTERGFYLTQDFKPPQIWQQVFGEHFVNNEFPGLDLTTAGRIKLYFNVYKRLLFVSIANADVISIYDRAFVLFTGRDEWGSFNSPHYGFGEVYISSGANTGYNFGYIDEDKYFRGTLKQLAHTRNLASGAYLKPGVFTYPPRQEDTTRIFSDRILMTTVDVSKYGDTAGFYGRRLQENPKDTLNAVWALTSELSGGTYIFRAGVEVGCGFQRYSIVINHFDLNAVASYISIGMFRGIDPEYNDRLTAVDNVTTIMSSGQVTADVEDWGSDIEFPAGSADEDWNTLSGGEDWGDNPTDSNLFSGSITGTVDGETVFRSSSLTLLRSDDKGLLFTCDVSGIYLFITVNALTSGQTFHLKSLSMNGIFAGRF